MNHYQTIIRLEQVMSYIASQTGIKIDLMLNAGETPKITVLAKVIHKQCEIMSYDVDEHFCYLVASMYVRTREDIEIKHGPKGGVVRKQLPEQLDVVKHPKFVDERVSDYDTQADMANKTSRLPTPYDKEM